MAVALKWFVETCQPQAGTNHGLAASASVPRAYDGDNMDCRNKNGDYIFFTIIYLAHFPKFNYYPPPAKNS